MKNMLGDAWMIKTKRIYDEAAPEDGVRVLVTRYWPRGVKKERTDKWVKQLGPSEKLLKEWKDGGMEWDAFAERYKGEFRCPAKQRFLDELKEELGGRDATLLCVCNDHDRCHTGLLKKLMEV